MTLGNLFLAQLTAALSADTKEAITDWVILSTETMLELTTSSIVLDLGEEQKLHLSYVKDGNINIAVYGTVTLTLSLPPKLFNQHMNPF